jgi:methionine-gamma-lyase
MKRSFSSLCVASTESHLTTPPHQLPIYATSSFVFDNVQDSIEVFTGRQSGHVYGRYGNPTIDAVAARIAELESYDLEDTAWGIMTSSGMSAISSLIMGLCESGDKILTQGNLYGGTTELFGKVLGKLGIETIYETLTDITHIADLLDQHPDTKVIYVETPSNPTMACIDLAAVATLARARGVITIVDNTFCTPYLQRPLTHGIDYVIHSTTKYLNGHGNSIAGIIIGRHDTHHHSVWQAVKLAGTNTNAWDAWLTANGLRTLTLRMDKHSGNALALAQYLDQLPSVNHVNYNGLKNHPYHAVASKQMHQYGGMLSFEVDGGQAAAIAVMDHLKLATQAPTLGDVDTLVLHPATSSHLNVDKQLCLDNGITDGLIRVSVGIEAAEDIIADFDQAVGQLA